MQGIANAAYLEGFPFSTLLSVAPYCAPGGIRVVSGVCGLRVANSFALDAQVTSGDRLLIILGVCANRSVAMNDRRSMIVPLRASGSRMKRSCLLMSLGKGGK